MSDPDSASIQAHSHFIRHRNVLMVTAELSPLYVDYYLHLNDTGLRPEPQHDEMEKDLLAIILLYATSRPWNEQFAWTLNFQDPLVNLFAAADNEEGSIIGTLFEDGVKESPHSMFYSESVRGNQPRHRSVVEFATSDVLTACEQFFSQSEQRTTRLFSLPNEKYIMLAAQPDYDQDWLQSLKLSDMVSLRAQEECSPLENRTYQWKCVCSQDAILRLAAATNQDDELFGGEDSLAATCPRCGRKYRLTREMVEAYKANQD
ncbi:MAG: disulfide bond chaperone [Verrucomicrobiota bacterium]